MGGHGKPDGRDTLGEIAAAVAAMLDGVRRHESAHAETLRGEAFTSQRAAALARSRQPDAAARAVEACDRISQETDAALADELDALRVWVDAFRACGHRPEAAA